MQYFPKKLSLRSSRGKYSSPVRKPHSSFPNGLCNLHLTISVSLGAIHSTKIPTGPTGKIGPPQKVAPFFFGNFSGWPGANRSTEFGPKFPEILVEWIAPIVIYRPPYSDESSNRRGVLRSGGGGGVTSQ